TRPMMEEIQNNRALNPDDLPVVLVRHLDPSGVPGMKFGKNQTPSNHINDAEQQTLRGSQGQAGAGDLVASPSGRGVGPRTPEVPVVFLSAVEATSPMCHVCASVFISAGMRQHIPASVTPQAYRVIHFGS